MLDGRCCGGMENVEEGDGAFATTMNIALTVNKTQGEMQIKGIPTIKAH